MKIRTCFVSNSSSCNYIIKSNTKFSSNYEKFDHLKQSFKLEPFISSLTTNTSVEIETNEKNKHEFKVSIGRSCRNNCPLDDAEPCDEERCFKECPNIIYSEIGIERNSISQIMIDINLISRDGDLNYVVDIPPALTKDMLENLENIFRILIPSGSFSNFWYVQQVDLYGDGWNHNMASGNGYVFGGNSSFAKYVLNLEGNISYKEGKLKYPEHWTKTF